jgi:hypothetical protein
LEARVKVKNSTRVVFAHLLTLMIALAIGVSGPATTALADGNPIEPPVAINDSIAGSSAYGPDGTSSMEEEYAEWFIILNTLLT